MTAFDDVALAIAGRLAADAIWHGQRCTWVGPVPDVSGRGTSAVTYGSLGPDLYGGTAGVGLVLAEVAAITGDRESRRGGVAALRHAVAHAGEIAPERSLGLYTGRAGVALAAIRAGLVLDEPELADGGRALMSDVGGALVSTPRAYDLVNGLAGAVVGLLAAAAALESRELVTLAVEAGDALIAAADVRGEWFWPEGGESSTPTGLAHGAAGIAHALLELWTATGERRHRQAGEGAIRGEQTLFDQRAGNWPIAAPAGDDNGASTVSHVSWCHGAPGIGLARTRAWELTGQEEWREEAAVALVVTSRWTRAALTAERGSYCLCHGLGGNAEVLRDCAHVTGPRAPEIRAVADEVACAGIDEFHLRGGRWPCGTPGGESPGLMTGLAGIARFYLRLGHPQLPSLLLPTPSHGWDRSDAGSGNGL